MILNLTPTEASDISYYLRAFCLDAPESFNDSEIAVVRFIYKDIAKQYDALELSGPDYGDIFIPINLSLAEAYQVQYYLGKIIFHKIVPDSTIPYIRELRGMIRDQYSAHACSYHAAQYIEAEEETIQGENV